MNNPSPSNEDATWHDQSTHEALRCFASHIHGLSDSDVDNRLHEYGKNRLPSAVQRSVFLRFLDQFHNILIYVLLGCAFITATLDHWIDTGVIVAVVIANAIIGFIQEGKAEKAMEALRHMLAPRAHVMRNGERTSVEGELLVPGDIVLIEAGDKVPADLRLLSTHGLYIQEALLTGESLPVEKNTESVTKDAPIGDRSCMAFSGTMVTSGQGKGIVVATGKNTEIGRISGLISEVETLATPLVVQMSSFAQWLTLFILVVAGALLTYGFFFGQHDFMEVFMAVVGLSVAAIPEGLPAVLTITLAVGVQAMAKRQAIVRRLPAIETLGSVSVICTDKTGTLTRNEMMVTSLLIHEHQFKVDGVGYEPQGKIHYDDGTELPTLKQNIFRELSLVAALCNDATLRCHNGIWHAEGDPMEGALLALATKLDSTIQEARTAGTRIDTIPFDSKHRFMATLYHHDNQAFILVKGAPERILNMCQNHYNYDGNVQNLTAEDWNEKIEKIAAQGERVLALAIKSVTPDVMTLDHHDVDGSLTLIGIVGMIDPPRAEAITAVSECHNAGISVKMITGDHAKTAAAIGKQIGLKNPDTVLEGADLDVMNDNDLHHAILQCDIFARTSPEHKLRLISALQSHGMAVAMTGDGVNDAPALKRADAGIAMGKKGSEAAKEAADVVLADDNFASIVAAIREGRTVYDNIQKVISWTLPTNAGEAMVVMTALLLGISLPITPIQILWINLITTVTLGIALAFEPTEENTMKRQPRSRSEPILSRTLAWHIALVSILFICGVYGIYTYAIGQGYTIELARTLVLNTVVVMEIFHLFFIRNIYGTSLTWEAVKGTKIIWCVVIVVTLAQFAVTYLAPLQHLFQTVSVPFWDGVIVIAVGVLLFVIIEVEKQVRLKLQGSMKKTHS